VKKTLSILSTRWLWQAILVLAAILMPVWVSSPYYLGICVTVIINGICAASFVLLLRTGLMNLGLVAFWGLGAYITTVGMLKWHISFWATLPLAGIICAVVGVGLGYILIGRGRGGFNFIVLSVVISMLFPVIVGVSGYLGGYTGVYDIPAPGDIHLGGLTLSFDSARGFYGLALFILLVVTLIAAAFYRSSVGRAWRAVGMDTRLADSLGIDVFRYRLVAIAVSSLMIGLAGSLYASYSTFISPAAFGMWQNTYIQGYAVLGGMSYPILGPLVGAGIMAMVPQWLQFTDVIAPLFMGVVLVILILFFPEGVLGAIFGRSGVRGMFVRALGFGPDGFRARQEEAAVAASAQAESPPGAREAVQTERSTDEAGRDES
jgi:branched-chain amino acid transport system permease protein